MKTPKLKAKELVEKYINIEVLGYKEDLDRLVAIECAKIAVDEIMYEVIHLQEESEGVYGANELFTRHSYWQEVKNELNSL